MQFAQGKFPSFLTYPASLLLILNFTPNPFDSSFPFKPSSVSLTGILISFPQVILSATWLIFGVNTEPWCNFAWTRKLSQKEPFTTRPQALLYNNCTNLTNHSSIPSFHQTHQTGILITQSKFFFIYANAKYKSFIDKYFSCKCLKMGMAFLIPCPGKKPNWNLFIFTFCSISFLIILLSIWKMWSVNFSLSIKHLLFPYSSWQ